MADPATDPMSDVFSFEEDIQPLQQRMFTNLSVSGLRPETKLMLMQEQRSRLFDRMAYEADAMYRRTRLEATQMQIEDAREKAAIARRNMEGMDEFQSMLTAALDDTLTADEQKRKLGQIGIMNASFIETNPIAKTAYTAATKAIPSSTSGSGSNKMFDKLDSVQFAKARSSGQEKDEFSSLAEQNKVMDVILTFGSPEEQALAESTQSPFELFSIAAKIRRRMSAPKASTNTTDTSGPRSLFTPP